MFFHSLCAAIYLLRFEVSIRRVAKAAPVIVALLRTDVHLFCKCDCMQMEPVRNILPLGIRVLIFHYVKHFYSLRRGYQLVFEPNCLVISFWKSVYSKRNCWNFSILGINCYHYCNCIKLMICSSETFALQSSCF